MTLWWIADALLVLVVLPVVAVIAVGVALGGRATPVAPVAAGLAVLLAGGEALAAGRALDWPVPYAAFGLLAVACAAAAVASRSSSRPTPSNPARMSSSSRSGERN